MRLALLLAPLLMSACIGSSPSEVADPSSAATPSPSSPGGPEGATNESQEDAVPAAPRDYSAHYEGWIQSPQLDRPWEFSQPFPVNASALNGTARAEVRSTYAVLGRLPRETANLTLEVMDPSGTVLAVDRRDATNAQPFVLLEVPEFAAVGNHTVRLSGYGGSDGSSSGDAFLLDVFVDY